MYSDSINIVLTSRVFDRKQIVLKIAKSKVGYKNDLKPSGKIVQHFGT